MAPDVSSEDTARTGRSFFSEIFAIFADKPDFLFRKLFRKLNSLVHD